MRKDAQFHEDNLFTFVTEILYRKLNSFVANALFLYPLKISENLTVF